MEWNIIIAITAATIVIVVSNIILFFPKSVCDTDEIALTVASPGSMTTFATISINTPNPRIKQPIIRAIILNIYADGCINERILIVRLIKSENITITGIWRKSAGLNLFLKRTSCISSKRILNKKVNIPTVGVNPRLSV